MWSLVAEFTQNSRLHARLIPSTKKYWTLVKGRTSGSLWTDVMTTFDQDLEASDHHGLVLLRISVTQETSDYELKQIAKTLSRRVTNSRRGILIDCRQLTDADVRTLEMFMQLQRLAVTERKRFALVGVPPEMKLLIAQHPQKFTLDCFGMPTTRTKSSGTAESKWRPPLDGLFGAPLRFWRTFWNAGRPLHDKRPTREEEKRRAQLTRLFRLGVITASITLPILYVISYFLDQQSHSPKLTKTFETKEASGVVVRGLVETVAVGGEHVVLPGAMVTAWPARQTNALTASNWSDVTTEAWSTVANARGMFELRLSPEQSAGISQLVIAVMAPISRETAHRGTVTMVSRKEQPSDFGDPLTKLFSITVSPMVESRLNILLAP